MDPKDTTSSPSRRAVLGGMSAGMVAAATLPGTSPASAQQAGGAAAVPPQAAKQNPLAQYPKPPFPRQQQEPPGLASKMEPRPDHGETSYRGAGKLIGRKALITGGDSGIGRAAAIAFAREGADVAINYLPVEEPDAREVVQLIEAEGRKAVAIPGDIRDEGFCNQLVARAVEGLGGLDILVNNAAKQASQQSILDITTEQFDATFKTNVYAMFWITKAALPHLAEGATIINTSSIQAYEPSANLLDYAQTKACIVSFTKSMAKQLAQKGIRVNAVAPGPFWTPLQPSGGQPPEKITSFGEGVPFGRPGQPAEVAPTYVLLASQESSYVTGEVYGITGGNPTP
ncbi:SDR family oxidoreductase [Skermanella mucosa]|uniref:SDR family oxidoreductase n=1 Tax=Skermanella mucosa TaxID=1789672 RepID=UPI00192CB4CF|nr:SDR family oxidoreductase [Skermanella mucosa]UEM23682.1 SDR family oxidoreductase [Skermanella mucosa]